MALDMTLDFLGGSFFGSYNQRAQIPFLPYFSHFMGFQVVICQLSWELNDRSFAMQFLNTSW